MDSDLLDPILSTPPQPASLPSSLPETHLVAETPTATTATTNAIAAASMIVDETSKLEKQEQHQPPHASTEEASVNNRVENVVTATVAASANVGNKSPIIHVHAGPPPLPSQQPPKRNVALKNTSAAAFSTRPAAIQNSFTRSINKDVKQIEIGDSDEDEYVPPGTASNRKMSTDSDSSESVQVKRKLAHNTKKPKIYDELVDDSDPKPPQNNELQILAVPVIKSTARKSTASITSRLLAQTNGRPSNTQTAMPRLISTASTTSQQHQSTGVGNGTATTVTGSKNKACMCAPKCESKSIQCRPTKRDQSTQIDNMDDLAATCRVQIVPVPVPVHVPVPMCMYQAPLPVPLLIPVPIPVPVIIPTTKKTYDRVHRKIKKLRQKLPSDPNEFELLLYAEKLAREEGIPGFEESSDGESEPETREKSTKSDTQKSTSDETTEQFISQDNTISFQLQQQQQQQEQQQLVESSESSFKWSIGVKVFNAWLQTKLAAMTNGANGSTMISRTPNELAKLTNDELNCLLAEFVHEVRKPNEEPYAPESVYYMCLGIQHYIEDESNNRGSGGDATQPKALVKDRRNIFLDAQFDRFQASFDQIAGHYKIRLDEQGLVQSRIDEELMWHTRQLGAHSPLVLLFTMAYMNTKCFFLDKREQHKKLSFVNVRKHIKKNVGPNGEDFGHTAYLRYYPEVQGHEQIIYEQCENFENPIRCPVQLHSFYLSKCPESVKTRSDVFYLMPEKASLPSSPIWFSSQPISDTMLDRMLNRIKMVKEVNDWLLATNPIQ